MSVLLLCPFCGGEADYLPDRLMAPGAPPPVFCDGCHASALDAEAWNQRSTPAEVAALRAEVERLREALERIANHPEANVVLTDYGPHGKQRVWTTVEQEARAALAKEMGYEG